eukprot:gnl/MRDRNA2_/MRDRNA2_89165_c0_seq1.p1 gnl/MRDRNA2_/MRDRNA2_89165_c0~~gnl/MRDRNA2_/MRDRNA2_89165_c0_seq1.p1  ORF type:complete len:577 (+),score=86.15 gnl/MRDRNA2_/MRDRNA2_89165_c0_seq1:142-1731(+)
MPEVSSELPAKKNNDTRANKGSHEVIQKPSLRLLVTAALQEKEHSNKVSVEPLRSPLSARRLRPHVTTDHISEKPSSARELSHSAMGHGHEKHLHHAHTKVEAGHGHEKHLHHAHTKVEAGHEHGTHPHHAHTMVDDHLKTPIDHSVHWTQLLLASKPHKQDFIEKSKDIIQRMKKNDDDVLEKLKDDPTAKLQQATLMSKIAGHIVNAIEQESVETIQHPARKLPPRTAKSLKRDAAIEKLAKVMENQHRSKHTAGVMKEEVNHEHANAQHTSHQTAEMNEKAAQEEDQVQEESWKTLAFDGSPARRREHKVKYTVITQRNKASRPNTPVRERKGEHPLDLIQIIEVTPHTPPRAQSVERDSFVKSITVHASDFIKYGNDVDMLMKLKLESSSKESPSTDEHVGGSHQSHIGHEQTRSHHVPVTGVPDLQVSRRRGHSQPSSARMGTSRTGTAGHHGNISPPSQPRSRPSSARTSRPVSRARGNTWPLSPPPSRPSSEQTWCQTKAIPFHHTCRHRIPFHLLKGQSEQ